MKYECYVNNYTVVYLREYYHVKIYTCSEWRIFYFEYFLCLICRIYALSPHRILISLGFHQSHFVAIYRNSTFKM